MAILRRRRDRSTPPPQPNTSIRPSLSLPDLTSPLLDPASWEELPFLPSPMTTSNVSTTPIKGRGRAPSLVGEGPGSPVQFHRPFTPWQVVNDPTVRFAGGYQPTQEGRWNRDSVTTVSGGVAGERRGRARGKNKVLGRFNVIVVGGNGVGKTSFVNLLVDSLESISEKGNHALESLSTRNPNITPASPTVPGPPVPMGPIGTTSPTTKFTSKTIQVTHPGYERCLLRLVDSPGLELAGTELGDKQRERGVVALIRLLEEKFGETLREESRIIRRGPRADDDLVHLVIYLIDSRVILRPVPERGAAPIAIDWSSIGLFDDHAQDPLDDIAPTIQRAQIATTEIEIIRKLSKRANVLPIITFTDALTMSELETVKSVVRRDLALAFGDGKIESPGRGFGVFFDIDADEEEEEDEESLETNAQASFDPRPLTPASTVPSHPSTDASRLPFGVFAPEHSSGQGMEFSRRYPWGKANVMNPEESDFLLLRDTILGTHTKILKTTTREVLYEQFRTEMLLAKHASSKMSQCS